MLAAGAGFALAQPALADPRSPSPRWSRLRESLIDIIGRRHIGLDLRHLSSRDTPLARIAINADNLYPTASCFKSLAGLYYFWSVPQLQWDASPGTAVFSTVVNSSNTRTGDLLDQVAGYVNVYGNPVQKFNDFVLYTMGLKSGLYQWNWPGNPIEGIVDRRFEPVGERLMMLDGMGYRVDNLTTAAELADSYAFMLNPPTDLSHAQAASEAALELLSIPSTDEYKSPFERVGFVGYTGKDGILPQGMLAAGNVVADAGIISVGVDRYILSFLSVGQSEYSAIEALRAIANRLIDYSSGL
jgi:hypothetical protein